MKLLLDEQYAPITSSIGFIEADYVRVVETFLEWQRHVLRPGADKELFETMARGAVAILGPPMEWHPSGYAVRSTQVSGPLSHALEALLPLTSPVSLRFLLVPTASAWTAYFDNSRRGTDADGPVCVLAARLGCRGLRIDATPDTLGTKSLYDKNKRGRYGATIFDLNGPGKGEHAETIRSIYAANDGGRWKFDAFGTPQPFEEPEHYKARRLRDRFPFELLDRYCRALGLRPFDEDFYLPPEQPTATLIEREGPPNTKTFSLAEEQAEWK